MFTLLTLINDIKIGEEKKSETQKKKKKLQNLFHKGNRVLYIQTIIYTDVQIYTIQGCESVIFLLFSSRICSYVCVCTSVYAHNDDIKSCSQKKKRNSELFFLSCYYFYLVFFPLSGKNITTHFYFLFSILFGFFLLHFYVAVVGCLVGRLAGYLFHRHQHHHHHLYGVSIFGQYEGEYFLYTKIKISFFPSNQLKEPLLFCYLNAKNIFRLCLCSCKPLCESDSVS